MKTRNLPIALLLLLFAHTTVQAEETGPVVETFACNFLDGSDAGDLDSAVSYWNQQVDKINDAALNQYSAWIISPIRSSLPADFFWLGAAPNLNNWATGNDAYASSDAGMAADERFAKMSRCTSAVWSAEQLFGDQDPPQNGETDILEAFGCTLHDGKTMANVRAVEANFIKEAKAAGLAMNIFRFSPMYTNGDVDLIYFVGYDDMTSYGKTATKASTTPATATANGYFGLVMDCAAGLFNATNIRTGQAPE